MGDSIVYCEQCKNRVGCHLARQCFHANDKVDGPIDAASCSGLEGREVAQIVGVITALAAMTSATPSLIIDKLTGTLWTIKEASDLLNAAKLYEPLNDRIIQDLGRRPNDQVLRC
jgi:hypothetical protein